MRPDRGAVPTEATHQENTSRPSATMGDRRSDGQQKVKVMVRVIMMMEDAKDKEDTTTTTSKQVKPQHSPPERAWPVA